MAFLTRLGPALLPWVLLIVLGFCQKVHSGFSITSYRKNMNKWNFWPTQYFVPPRSKHKLSFKYLFSPNILDIAWRKGFIWPLPMCTLRVYHNATHLRNTLWLLYYFVLYCTFLHFIILIMQIILYYFCLLYFLVILKQWVCMTLRIRMKI